MGLAMKMLSLGLALQIRFVDLTGKRANRKCVKWLMCFSLVGRSSGVSTARLIQVL